MPGVHIKIAPMNRRAYNGEGCEEAALISPWQWQLCASPTRQSIHDRQTSPTVHRERLRRDSILRAKVLGTGRLHLPLP
jgi:hypothetical protein